MKNIHRTKQIGILPLTVVFIALLISFVGLGSLSLYMPYKTPVAPQLLDESDFEPVSDPIEEIIEEPESEESTISNTENDIKENIYQDFIDKYDLFALSDNLITDVPRRGPFEIEINDKLISYDNFTISIGEGANKKELFYDGGELINTSRCIYETNNSNMIVYSVGGMAGFGGFEEYYLIDLKTGEFVLQISQHYNLEYCILEINKEKEFDFDLILKNDQGEIYDWEEDETGFIESFSVNGKNSLMLNDDFSFITNREDFLAPTGFNYGFDLIGFSKDFKNAYIDFQINKSWEDTVLLKRILKFNLETETLSYEIEEKLNIVSPKEEEELIAGKDYVIEWIQQDLTNWGNIATICLEAFDENNQPIFSKKPGENKSQICWAYVDSTTHPLLIKETELDNNSYLWSVPSNIADQYESKPTSYRIKISVIDYLPEEGRSEWAGTIKEAVSGFFIIQ